MDLKEIGVLGGDQERHWYYASKWRALLAALGGRAPAHILDVGAGTGFFSRKLLSETSAQRATCVDSGYLEDSVDRHHGKPIAFRRASPVGDADLVLLMDVLEHVDDDVGLMREFAAEARPGTRFIVSVPAFSWLWSGHDVFFEHRRRYTLKRIRRVLVEAGLSPIGGFYFFASVFPAAVVQRLWRRASGVPPRSALRRHHTVTNFALTRICIAESIFARYNRAFGLTAFAMAEKR